MYFKLEAIKDNILEDLLSSFITIFFVVAGMLLIIPTNDDVGYFL